MSNLTFLHSTQRSPPFPLDTRPSPTHRLKFIPIPPPVTRLRVLTCSWRRAPCAWGRAPHAYCSASLRHHCPRWTSARRRSGSQVAWDHALCRRMWRHGCPCTPGCTCCAWNNVRVKSYMYVYWVTSYNGVTYGTYHVDMIYILLGHSVSNYIEMRATGWNNYHGYPFNHLIHG